MLAQVDRKQFFKALRAILRYVSPVRSTNDVPDRLSVDVVVESDGTALLASRAPGSNDRNIDLRDLRGVDSGTACRRLGVRVSGIPSSRGHESVDGCVANVLWARHPFEILKPIVCLDAVLVVHLRLFLRRFAEKGTGHKPVDGVRPTSAVASQPHSWIAVAIEFLSHYMRSLAMAVSNAPRGGHHSAKIGDGIQSFKSRARSPLLYGSLLLSHDGPPLRISGQSCGGVSAPSRLAAILPLNSSVYWGFSS